MLSVTELDMNCGHLTYCEASETYVQWQCRILCCKVKYSEVALVQTVETNVGVVG
jgi:hypothetical protein